MITEEIVREALKEVYDPEVSLSVQDLGLIYEVICEGTHVHIKHTLTSMMCPFADEICEGIEEAVGALDGVQRGSAHRPERETGESNIQC
jgi:metal-sulfur cluster biosynthetic enzyme